MSSLKSSTTTNRIRLLYLLIVLFVVGNNISNYNYDNNAAVINNNNRKRQMKEEEEEPTSNSRIIIIDNNNNPTYYHYPQTEKEEKEQRQLQQSVEEVIVEQEKKKTISTANDDGDDANIEEEEENEEKVIKEQQPSSLATEAAATTATTTTDTTIIGDSNNTHSYNKPQLNDSLLLLHGFNKQPYYTMDNYTYYVSEQFDPQKSTLSHQSTTTNTNTNNTTDDQVVIEKEKKTICFVKCSYGNSINDVDKFNHKSNSVKRIKMLSGYQFYYITNLPEINVNVSKLGWKTILLQNLPFQRQITQSPYGKFMSWKIPLISHNCHTIFYLDGQITLRVPSKRSDIFKTIDLWSNVANQIHNSSSGLLQPPHPKYNVMGEIDAITRQGKDTKENMGITLKWLIEQPSTMQLSDIQIYVNTIFGYNPTNVQYQLLSNEFWEHYSKEYGSWRDQLIWAYFLYKYQMKPIWLSGIIPKKLTRVTKNLKGFGGHTYVNVTKNNNNQDQGQQDSYYNNKRNIMKQTKNLL